VSAELVVTDPLGKSRLVPYAAAVGSNTLDTPTKPNPPAQQRLMRFLDDFRDSFSANISKQQRDLRYYDGDQLNSTRRRKLKAANQPEIVVNEIKPAVNGTLGVVERGKTDPRAYPRTQRDDDAADVATDVLRYTADYNRFQRHKLMVLKDILTVGDGATAIEMADDEVTLTKIDWDEFFFDPRSRREDFKDAAFMGVAKWVYADKLKTDYPDHAKEIEACAAGNSFSPGSASPFADKPDSAGTATWIDAAKRRLMTVEVYYLEGGEWLRCMFTGAGSVVLEHDVSPWKDDKGRSICGIEAQSAYVDAENNRYGMVRDMIDAQDEINSRRAAALALMRSSQVQQSDLNAPPVDVSIVRAEAKKPDGVIPPGWTKVPTDNMTQWQFQMMQVAKEELRRFAPIPSMVGRADGAASGRAQLVQSQAGMTEMALLLGGFTDWEQRVYKQVWWRWQQFQKDPKWIRVTDDAQAPRFRQVNEIVEPEILALDPNTQQPVVGPDGQPHVLKPAVTKNRPADMDMDIIVDAVPDTANLQQEQFAEVMQLLQSNPAWAQEVTFADAIELSSLVHKREFKKKLDERAQQRMQQQGQEQAHQAQMAAREAEAKAGKLEAGATLDSARADAITAEAVLKTETHRFNFSRQLASPIVSGGPAMMGR
jgi:hypothetical protein